jgi:hypothetical protein
MLKGKSLRRALETNDLSRLHGDMPLITDTTEWITKELALSYLENNKRNRVVNWRAVEDYAEAMKSGDWKFHGQGIMFDQDGNLLTGQKRLWALVYSGLDGIYMRVSRGNPREAANLIDRGTPQTARDLASRESGRKHGPSESSIARAICALNGNMKPSADELAATIYVNGPVVASVLKAISGTRKTKAVLMIVAALANKMTDPDMAAVRALRVEEQAERLEARLQPHTAKDCWNRGAAFGLAMKYASEIA